MQADSRVDDAEDTSTIEINHKIRDKSTPLEFLIFERSSVGEDAQTSATVKHVYQPYVHIRNDKLSTDIIEQLIQRNRITSWEGDCGATEDSAVPSTKYSDMVINGVYDGGQVSSVIDNSQEDRSDHRGHMRELNDLMSNSVPDTACTALTPRNPAIYGPSMVEEPNQEEDMEKSSCPLNHDLLFEKYYQMLKMVRSFDGIYFIHGP